MSSEIISRELTDREVNTLNKVLLDSGYTGTMLQGSAGMNVAAKLIIRLLHKGITDPKHYTTELESAFGRPQVALYAPKGLHRYAIRGLPRANDEGFPSPNETPQEEKMSSLKDLTHKGMLGSAVAASDRTTINAKEITLADKADRDDKSAHLRTLRQERDRYIRQIH